MDLNSLNAAKHIMSRILEVQRSLELVKNPHNKLFAGQESLVLQDEIKTLIEAYLNDIVYGLEQRFRGL